MTEKPGSVVALVALVALVAPQAGRPCVCAHHFASHRLSMLRLRCLRILRMKPDGLAGESLVEVSYR